jgi:high-affinity K+ transport system ATPase subunit B
VEAAGDVVPPEKLADATQLSSLADETPEGRSIVVPFVEIKVINVLLVMLRLI